MIRRNTVVFACGGMCFAVHRTIARQDLRLLEITLLELNDLHVVGAMFHLTRVIAVVWAMLDVRFADIDLMPARTVFSI